MYRNFHCFILKVNQFLMVNTSACLVKKFTAAMKSCVLAGEALLRLKVN